MLSDEIISVLIKLSQWTNPDLNRAFYFIVEAIAAEESSHLKGLTPCASCIQLEYYLTLYLLHRPI